MRQALAPGDTVGGLFVHVGGGSCGAALLDQRGDPYDGHKLPPMNAQFIAKPHLARGLWPGAIHVYLSTPDCALGKTAGLEKPCCPEPLVEAQIVFIGGGC